jgi:hypothetical protein
MVWVPYGYHRGDDILAARPDASVDDFGDLPACLGFTGKVADA